MEYAESDWADIVTPVHVPEFERLLKGAKYDKSKTRKLVDGFTCGFDLGYRGPKTRQDTSRNIPIRPGVGSLTDMWNKVMKEVKASRYAGPFVSIPFTNYVQSPIGLVPKAGNKTRLIFHLSFDFDGDNVLRKSINYHTPKELCTVKYRDLDHAIVNSLRILKEKGDGEMKNQLFFAKSDFSNAFRILPMAVKYRKFLVLKAQHPVTKKWYFFVDKCLPFGASISCANFQEFSDGVAHIVKWKISCTMYITNPALTNYLDDFLFIALSMIQCNGMVRIFLEICKKIGCPISMEKTEWASQLLIFLGILLNGRTLTLSVLTDKCMKAISLLNSAVQSKKGTVKFVQKLTGTLNFLNRAIAPGRSFTRAMYAKLRLRTNAGRLLKDYRHVTFNYDFIQDCQMWLSFLTNQSKKGICRQFADLTTSEYKGEVLFFFSDASRNEQLGMGAVFDNRRWLWAQWPEKFIKRFQPSIEYLKLYALVAAMLTWNQEPKLNNKKIVIFCDNEAVVRMVNNLASSCLHCMKLIRVLVVDGLIHNRKITCRHIRSENNVLSDALSRLDFKRFWANAPSTMCSQSDTIAVKIWPIDRF